MRHSKILLKCFVIFLTRAFINYIQRSQLGWKLAINVSLCQLPCMVVSSHHWWQYYNVDLANNMLALWASREMLKWLRISNSASNVKNFGLIHWSMPHYNKIDPLLFISFIQHLLNMVVSLDSSKKLRKVFGKLRNWLKLLVVYLNFIDKRAIIHIVALLLAI